MIASPIKDRETGMASILRSEAAPEGSFGCTLRELRLAAGVSQNHLAKTVGMNASYLSRLESGERDCPTREATLALARGMRLGEGDTDLLLGAAGHLTPALARLGSDDHTVAAVARLLADERVPLPAKDDFRAVVETMALRWRAGLTSVATERAIAKARAS